MTPRRSAEARVLRGREAAFRELVDRAKAGAPELGAARRLVQVYDGGSIPSGPDRWYLAHPVELDGAEVEGGAGAPSADAAESVPVLVLGHGAEVGDLLVATGVGGRWVAERGGSSGLTVCVVACAGPNVPVVGAGVSLSQSGVLKGSCTTGAGGCCRLSLPAGTYDVRVTVSGSVAFAATRTLSSGTTTIVLSSGTGLVCCGAYAIPVSLTGTDALGSFPMVYDPNYFFPIWTGGHPATRPSVPVTTPNNTCIVGDLTDGPVRVCYQMICHSDTEPVFAVQRSWSWVYLPGTLTPVYYQDPSGFSPGQLCITAPPAICGNPLTDTASFGADPSSTSPFVVTGTPVAPSSNATPDPVGGTLVISA